MPRRRIGDCTQTDKADELLVVCGSVKPPRSAPCVALAFASLSEETYLFVGSQVRRSRATGCAAASYSSCVTAMASTRRRPRVGSTPSRRERRRRDTKSHRSRATRTTTTARRRAGHVLTSPRCHIWYSTMLSSGQTRLRAGINELRWGEGYRSTFRRPTYATDERRGALGFDGPKTALACLGDGLVAVACVGRYKRSEVTIHGVVQRRVVHFARLQQGVAAACFASGALA